MSYKVIIDIIANGQKAVTEFDRAGRAAERMAKKTTDEVEKTRISTEKLGRQAGIIGVAMLGAAGSVAFAMRGWVKSAQEAEQAQMRLESSVRGAYGASSNAVRAFEAQAKAIQKVTVASDEDVMSIQAMLVQFGLTQRQVSTLTPLVIDIARKWGIDYVTAAKAVSKAADGKATALKRLGINVDEVKAKTDPYIATVEALRRAAGGFAQQEGKTFAGQTAILKNQMDELKESLGRGVLSALNDVLPAVNGVAGAFTSIDDKTSGLVGRTTALATGFLFVSGAALVTASTVVKVRAAYDEATASSARFAMAQKTIGIGFSAIAGYIIGSAIVDGVAKWGDKINDGVRGALNARTAAEAFKEFERAATAQNSKESSGFINLGKGIGAAVVQGASLGSVRLYENLDNKWKRAAFEKTFQKVFQQDPEAARQILKYIDADDKRHAAFVRMGVDLDKYQEMVKGKLIDTNRDGVKSIEEKLAWDEKQAQAAETVISVTNGQAAAARGFQQAIIGVQNAQASVTEAQKAYNDAVKSGDPERVKDAQLQLQSALLALADAQDAARDAAFKHGEMLIALQDTANDPEQYKEAIAKLERMKALLTDPAEKQAIQDKINMLTWFRAMAQAPIDTKNIVGPLGAINVELERIKANMSDPIWTRFGTVQQTVVEGILRGLNHRASGGPVAAGTPYVVGENGPELFVPSSSGSIVPNSQMTSTGSSVSSWGGITIGAINVASSPLSSPAETGAAVVDALKAYERRSGPLPLRVA